MTLDQYRKAIDGLKNGALVLIKVFGPLGSITIEGRWQFDPAASLVCVVKDHQKRLWRYSYRRILSISEVN